MHSLSLGTSAGNGPPLLIIVSPPWNRYGERGNGRIGVLGAGWRGAGCAGRAQTKHAAQGRDPEALALGAAAIHGERLPDPHEGAGTSHTHFWLKTFGTIGKTAGTDSPVEPLRTASRSTRSE